MEDGEESYHMIMYQCAEEEKFPTKRYT